MGRQREKRRKGITGDRRGEKVKGRRKGKKRGEEREEERRKWNIRRGDKEGR